MESSLYILGYNEPAVVGTSISFNCLNPEEVLIGSDTAMCINDGRGVPDPNILQISCKGT